MSFKSIAIFLAGAAVGAVASYFFTKEKIERQAQENIDAMEKTFKEKYSGEESATSDSISEKTFDKETTPAPSKPAKKTNYARF